MPKPRKWLYGMSRGRSNLFSEDRPLIDDRSEREQQRSQPYRAAETTSWHAPDGTIDTIGSEEVTHRFLDRHGRTTPIADSDRELAGPEVAHLVLAAPD